MTLNRVKPILTVAAVLVLTAVVPAQQDERARALEQQIDRIYQASEYALPRFGPARWLADGTAYTTVERSPGTEGSDIVRYDAATGARSVLISTSQLTPPGATRPLSISDYVWSDDAGKLLIFTNTRKVWRQNTRGDYWVLSRSAEAPNRQGSATGSTSRSVGTVVAAATSTSSRRCSASSRTSSWAWATS